MPTKICKKSISFIFYSTSAEKKYATDAYLHLTVRGFFSEGPHVSGN